MIFFMVRVFCVRAIFWILLVSLGLLRSLVCVRNYFFVLCLLLLFCFMGYFCVSVVELFVGGWCCILCLWGF